MACFLAYSCVFSFVADAAPPKFQYEILLRQGDVIWGFDFLPDSRIIFTERGGKLKIFDPNTRKVRVIKGVPKVWARGQGGLLDVRYHDGSGKIFFTFSDPANGGATTSLASAELDGDRLVHLKKIFAAKAANRNTIHFGSRIEFDKSGHVFVTIGDRNERHRAQDLSSHHGKIVRLNLDGSVPKDNPFVNRKDALPEIWSLGHRSPQGLAIRPETGDLWMAEMGPLGGDEVNLIRPGKNYGWPLATYGREYSGEKIGSPTHPGTEQPVVYWVPSISPSGMAFYSGKAFPDWTGNIFLANLSGQHLRRLVLQGDQVVSQEVLLKDRNTRFRNVRTGPEGFLYLSTDGGQLARLVPGPVSGGNTPSPGSAAKK